MTLGRQLLLLGAVLLLLVTLAITLVVSDLYGRSYRQQVSQHSRGVHRLLAEGLAGSVIRGEPLDVRGLLREARVAEPGVAYLYVTDFDGRLFAHTFEGGFPRALLQTLRAPGEGAFHRRFRTADGEIDHFSAPLIPGMAARLHLGMSDRRYRSTLSSLRRRVLVSAVAVAALGLLFGTLVVRRIAEPLGRLTSLVERYGRGERLTAGEIPAGGPREVRELGRALGGMMRERDALEAALREREAYVRMLFESSPVGLALTRMDGTLVEVNPAYAAILGRSVEEVLGLTYWEITPRDYLSQEQAQLTSLERTGRYGPYEKEYWHRDGRRVPVRLSGRLLEREGRRYIWSVVEDISAAREAEALGTRLKNLLEHSFDEIYIFDARTLGFVQVSRGALENLGFTMEEMREMTPVDLKPEFTLETFHALVDPVRRGEQQQLVFETRHRRRDGSEYPVEVRLQFSREGGRPMFFAIVLDLTERRRAEAELSAYRDHLEELVRRRTAELEAANRELESFSYSVSHDLRSPLRAIDGFSLALMEDYGARLDETALDYLRRVRGGAQRMGMLIDDLLQLSRVSRTPLRMEEVDLGAIAREVMEELEAGEPGRRVVLTLGEGLRVRGDARLLRVMLDNLLGNAWKFTAREAVSRIAFDRLPDRPGVFYIRDNGVGFDRRHMDKLFGAFQRLHRVTEFPGTGVGLATVQRIVHRHGGLVWADARVGEGASFYFVLGPREASGDASPGNGRGEGDAGEDRTAGGG